MGGTKNDEGKLRMDLISPKALMGMVDVLTKGAEQYSDRNWEEGIKYGRVYAACIRHLFAWWGGGELDPDDGQHHLDHAACCIHFLSAYVKGDYKEYDDRPKKRERTGV